MVGLKKYLLFSIRFVFVVLHRETGDVVHHDLAAVVRPLRGRQLGRGQGLPLHHTHLQRKVKQYLPLGTLLMSFLFD